MEIKLGMYVRTKNGIAKIIGFTKNYTNYFRLDRNIMDEEDYLGSLIYCYRFYEKQILKASNSTIDLIEVGDYVNGLRINSITEADKNNDVRLVWHLNTYGDDDISFSNEEIKSIVTKEQFESMKYIVERDD